MARIRTIKPEFFTSEQIVECSTNARLQFLGLLVFSDDGGRHPASIKRLKMEAWPGDSCSLKDVEKWQEELISAGLVGEYETTEGKRLWWVTGWEKHQRVDKPNIKFRGPFDDGSTITRQPFGDRSPPESNGVESNGVESNKEPPTPFPDFPTLNTEAFQQTWCRWQLHRREIKHPLKPTQAKSQLKMLADLGHDRAIAMIEHTIAMGWQGLREADGSANGNQKKAHLPTTEDLDKWNPYDGGEE